MEAHPSPRKAKSMNSGGFWARAYTEVNVGGGQNFFCPP